MSYKLRKIARIEKEITMIQGQSDYDISGIDIAIAKFFYRMKQTDVQATTNFEDMASGDYTIRQSNNSKTLVIQNQNILDNGEAIQICYVVDLTSSKYETDFEVDINTLKTRYNEAVDDIHRLWEYIKTTGMVADDLSIDLILPKLKVDQLWVRTETGYKGVSLTDAEGMIKDIIDKYSEEKKSEIRALVTKLTSDFEALVKLRTEQFETLVVTRTTEFNNLVSSSTTTFNALVSTSRTNFDALVTTRRTEFNALADDREQKLNDLGALREQQLNNLNTELRESFNTLYEQKVVSFNDLVSNHITDFNSLVLQSRTDFDLLADKRTESFVQVVTTRTQEFETLVTDRRTEFVALSEAEKLKLTKHEGVLEIQLTDLKAELAEQLKDLVAQATQDNGLLPPNIDWFVDVKQGQSTVLDAFNKNYKNMPIDLMDSLDGNGILFYNWTEAGKNGVLRYYTTTKKMFFTVKVNEAWSEWQQMNSNAGTTMIFSQINHGFTFNPVSLNGTTGLWELSNHEIGADGVAVRMDDNQFQILFNGTLPIPSGAVDQEGDAFVLDEYYFTSSTVNGKFQRTKPTSGIFQPMFYVIRTSNISYAVVNVGEVHSLNFTVVDSTTAEKMGFVTQKTFDDYKTVVNSQIAALQETINTDLVQVKADIKTNTDNIGTNTNNIASNLVKINANAKAITDLDAKYAGEIKRLEGLITALDNKLTPLITANTNAINALTTRMTTAEGTITSHTSSINSMNATLGTKANIANPTFTGTVTIPTLTVTGITILSGMTYTAAISSNSTIRAAGTITSANDVIAFEQEV
jgi:uncharacterized protein YukE/arsenate reductase-like glutaredoxin family protein